MARPSWCSSSRRRAFRSFVSATTFRRSRFARCATTASTCRSAGTGSVCAARYTRALTAFLVAGRPPTSLRSALCSWRSMKASARTCRACASWPKRRTATSASRSTSCSCGPPTRTRCIIRTCRATPARRSRTLRSGACGPRCLRARLRLTRRARARARRPFDAVRNLFTRRDLEDKMSDYFVGA